MKTRCPGCRTRYDVDAAVLREARGLARCHHCGEVFDAFEHALEPGIEQLPEPALLDDTLLLEEEDLPAVEPRPPRRRRAAPPSDPDLVPPRIDPLDPVEDPLEPDGPLDGDQVLDPPRPAGAPWWQRLLVAALAIALLLQLAWLRRDLWIDLPVATQLCVVLDCELPERRRPEAFEVIERRFETEPGDPPALRLWLAIRNGADFAQPLPRMQLSLFDSNGELVARRLFPPRLYLPEDWQGPQRALPGETVTFELRLVDPGPRASSFVIDFY